MKKDNNIASKLITKNLENRECFGGIILINLEWKGSNYKKISQIIYKMDGDLKIIKSLLIFLSLFLGN